MGIDVGDSEGSDVGGFDGETVGKLEVAKPVPPSELVLVC